MWRIFWVDDLNYMFMCVCGVCACSCVCVCACARTCVCNCKVPALITSLSLTGIYLSLMLSWHYQDDAVTHICIFNDVVTTVKPFYRYLKELPSSKPLLVVVSLSFPFTLACPRQAWMSNIDTYARMHGPPPLPLFTVCHRVIDSLRMVACHHVLFDRHLTRQIL